MRKGEGIQTEREGEIQRMNYINIDDKIKRIENSSL